MIIFDHERALAFKCDLCGGEPECAAICPSGAIEVRMR
jgi:Fe-S-cluster-containing hydrogenase component 2